MHYLVGPPRFDESDHLAPRSLQRLVPGLSQHDVYLCGPEPMMAAARRSLRDSGVPRRNIHDESFTF